MAPVEQLPHLLRLLDDDTPAVRKAVVEHLEALGDRLGPALDSMPEPPAEGQLELIGQLLLPAKQRRLEEKWEAWLRSEGNPRRLEKAMELLSDFLGSPLRRRRLGEALDRLAAEYRLNEPQPEVRSLVSFLFLAKGLRGAQVDYYRPENSDLLQVLERRQGLPISLVILLLLVARRLDLKVEGCNFPGHFLARFQEGKELVLIDCFHEGRFLDLQELTQLYPKSSQTIRTIARLATPTEAIVARVLRNLIRAFQQVGQAESQGAFLESLLRKLEGHQRRWERNHQKAQWQAIHPLFWPGSLVRLAESDRRGVVVDLDPEFKGPRPGRDAAVTTSKQPWYHVLIDDGTTIQYLPEESWQADSLRTPIRHPLIPYFFSGFEGGRYQRNGLAWPRD
ncbi:MAG: heat shock protein HspQ [Planctomycetota bacterium]|nr:MAG: heat shock protein HspQ [Planctomycetota bacterium]